MPARPPETPFYRDSDNEQLWRDISRLYDYFVGGDNERVSRFQTVLRDMLTELGDGRHQEGDQQWAHK